MFEYFKELTLNYITPTILLAVIGYIFKGPISTFLFATIEQKHRKELAKFSQSLDQKTSELHNIQQHLLDGISNKNNLLVEKQIWATEQIWKGIAEDKKHTFAVNFMKTLKFEWVEENLEDSNTQDFLNVLNKISGMENLLSPEKIMEAKKEGLIYNLPKEAELYVSSKALKLSKIHSSIAWQAVLTLKCWSERLSAKNFLKGQELIDSIIELWPSYKEYFEDGDLGKVFYIWDTIENELFKELKIGLFGDVKLQPSISLAKDALDKINTDS